MGDIGLKLGDNDATIGYLRLRGVRIPRRHLLEKLQHVTPDGAYVRGAGPAAKAAPKGQPKKQSEGGKSKAVYITMLKTRVALTNTAAGALAKACTIAARYSAVRHQGFLDTRADQDYSSPEGQILDYENQLFRVLRWTSTAYALKLVARWLLERRKQAERSDDPGDDLPELHASAAGLKGLGCVIAADGIEDLRRACGGHGYLMSSGIAPLEADFKGPNTTAEGDYVILLLQTARFLTGQVDAARQKKPLVGLTACLAPLADASFDPVRDGKPPPVTDPAALLDGDGSGEGRRRARAHLVGLFAYRTLVACSKSHGALQEAQAKGMGIDQARNANARMLYSLSATHVKYFALAIFAKEVDAMPDAAGDGVKEVLHELLVLFALSDVLAGERWAGLLEAAEVDAADAAVSALCKRLRPNAVALTDAFDFSDTVLNSALGRYDGRVYEALYASARASNMNIASGGELPSVGGGGVPAFFDGVRKYLDSDFLAAHAQGDPTGGRAGAAGSAKL